MSLTLEGGQLTGCIRFAVASSYLFGMIRRNVIVELNSEVNRQVRISRQKVDQIRRIGRKVFGRMRKLMKIQNIVI
jgi:hypothetical protein